MVRLLEIDEAVKAVTQGHVIAYPTEAIYGLGCDPDNLTAVQAILTLKARAANKGLILIASQWQQVEKYIGQVSPANLSKAFASWPGPVTWVMPANPSVPNLLTGGRNTIAVRISDHPVVRALCDGCNHALVSTSANISGTEPITCSEEIDQMFPNAIAGTVKGELGLLTSATSIFDVQTGVQIR